MTGPIICGNCGSISQEPKSGNRGSVILEILLWLFFILPGIIYTIWRRRGKPCCRKCGSENIMPLNTPGGQEKARRDLGEMRSEIQGMVEKLSTIDETLASLQDRLR